LTARSKASPDKDHFAFYMDLLGHDVLNNNQAVLSYLELISATPGIGKNTKLLAEKAVSHVRTSTVLIENVKRLIAARDIQLDKLKPTDLIKSIEKAEIGLLRHFPAKRIRLERLGLPKNAIVLGDSYADELILNVLITAVRLSLSDDISLGIRCAIGEAKRKPVWITSVEIDDVQLPPFLDGESVSATYQQDISTAVKTTGFLFAKMLAESLGGDFEVRSIKRHVKKSGAVFSVILRRVEGP
jgi:hypothetical protein